MSTKRGLPGLIWAGRRAPHLRPECLRAGKACCAHLFNMGQCAAIQMGELVMNGGNCFSLCPISRRRQKPLLPRQTMPLCGRQRPAACTSPALCEPPIATPGSRATASGTLSQCETHTGSQGGLVRHSRDHGHMAMPAQPAWCSLPSGGRGAAAGDTASLLHGSMAAAAAAAAGQGRTGDINNSHTKEKGGGVQRAGAREV